MLEKELKMKTHKRHKAVETAERCFSGPVGERQNPAAHGGVCYIETCSCGAKRRTNVNGMHSERGQWVEVER